VTLRWNSRDRGGQGPVNTPLAGVSRRATLARGVLGLAAAWGLVGCASPEDAVPEASGPQHMGDLANLLEGPPPVVAGEELDAPLLHRFYERRGFEPVWTTRRAEADALKAMVLRARDHGLDPELFQADLLRRMDAFPPSRRELLLSHAVLTYAEALAYGALPPERRRHEEALMPDSVDVTEVLHANLDDGDPVAAIQALAPSNPTYRALRQALQRLPVNGRLDRAQASRVRQIEANLERQRWLPRQLPADRVWVNVPDQQLVFYRDHRPVFVTRVVVGEELERKQSPEFNTVIESALFNPPWIIPADIVEADIKPRAAREPDFLKRYKISLLPNGEAEQAPGPDAGLGAVMFEMPNRFDVYLHDTPERDVFGRENRRLSNGCIRVHNPLEFAALLMEEPLDVIHRKVATAGTVRRPLPNPVPVFVLYHTAFAYADNTLQTRPDFYGRDDTLWQRLQKNPAEPQVPSNGRVAGSAGRASPAPRGPAQPAGRAPTIPRRT
jgi:murein L,D-transpeptidase YcbB/YkuD